MKKNNQPHKYMQKDINQILKYFKINIFRRILEKFIDKTLLILYLFYFK